MFYIDIWPWNIVCTYSVITDRCLKYNMYKLINNMKWKVYLHDSIKYYLNIALVNIVGDYVSVFQGSWSDVRGTKSVLIISILSSGVCYFLLGVTHSIYFIAFLRILLGNYVCIISQISPWDKNRKYLDIYYTIILYTYLILFHIHGYKKL